MYTIKYGKIAETEQINNIHHFVLIMEFKISQKQSLS